MKRTSILPLLTLVLAFFLAITQSTAQTDGNAVTVSVYSVSPTDLDSFIPNKDKDGNYNLVDPKPVLRVLFEGCDQVEYATEKEYDSPSDEGGVTVLTTITEDWYESIMADAENKTYPNLVKLGLHEYCYITYVDQNSVTQRVSLAIDDPDIDKEQNQVIFKFITSDLEYIPASTVFQLHIPKFSCFTEVELLSEAESPSEEQGVSKVEMDVTYENSTTVLMGEYGSESEDEIIFEFRTKDCNVVSGGKESYSSTDADLTPLIVCNKSDYIIDGERVCSQLIVEPGSGIRIKDTGSLTVVDTAYFIGPDTYDLTLRPYLINYGTFDNDNSSEVKEGESEEVVGRTVFTHTVAMTKNDNLFRKVRLALPIKKCIGTSLSTFYDDGVGFAFVKERFIGTSTYYFSTILRSHSSSSGSGTEFAYTDLNLYCRPGFHYTKEYDRNAILRLNGKINNEFGYSFDNESAYSSYSDLYRLVCSRFSANNVLQAPIDMRKIYEEERTDALGMWISYGKNNNYFVYNCKSGITTFDGDMREGYLLPQMSFFFANQNSNYDNSGEDNVELRLHFEYTKDDLKTYNDIIDSKSYTKDDNNSEIDVDYKYIRFYVQGITENNPDYGNRCVFAVYFMPKEDYDTYVAPYRYGQTGMPKGSNQVDGHLNPVYECMIDCDGNSQNTTVDGGLAYTSYQPNFYSFPIITSSCYNGYDVAGIYDIGKFEYGYYDGQRGLLIKCLPEPQPCNMDVESQEGHNHDGDKVPVYDEDTNAPVYEEDGVTQKTQTKKVCAYKALDLPLIIRATNADSEVALGILDTNIDANSGLTLEDAEDTNNAISTALLAGETYTVKFSEDRTQLFGSHSGIEVPYTIIKLKVVPYPEYSSDAVMPDDPDLGGGSAGSEDLDPNPSGSEGEGGEGTGSGSGSGGTTPTPTPTPTPEAISTVQTSTVSVVAKQSAVEVRGTQPGAVCAIYDLTGAQVAQKTSAGSTVTLQVPKAGIYFIAVAQENTTKTFKTIVK